MQENSSRHPVVPLAMQRQLTPNLLDAIRPYQVMYDQIMMRLEQLMHTITPRQMGRTATQQALLAEANEVRTQAEAAVGISRERYGRIQEYPMTPAEVFPRGQYIAGIDPIRRGHEADSEGVFSVQHRRQDGTWEQVHSEPIRTEGLLSQMNRTNQVTYSSLTRERLEEVFSDLFYSRPPERRPMAVSAEVMQEFQQAERRLQEEFERSLWYGSATPRKTRRDKKVVVSTSIYWEYQPFD